MSLQTKRKYKITIILDTRGYDSPVGTLEEKVSAMLGEIGAEVESIQNLGRQDFVRVTVTGHEGDTYLVIMASGDASLPATFQERVRLNKEIKRVLVQSA